MGFRFKFTEVRNKDVPPEMGRYGPDTFTIKASDIENVNSAKSSMWQSGKIRKITLKL